MKLSHRAYPHPVLGNGDDIVDTAFQCPIEVENDGANYFISVKVQSNSKTLSKLIEKGDAVYALHVECSNTLFRKAVEFKESEKEVMIAGEDLNATVEVNVFARAKREIKRYRIENAHPDYGDATFNIMTGDVLAIAEGHIFDADINFDALRSVSSIMHISERNEAGDGPMDINLSDDKITVYLSKPDFENYKLIRAHKVLAPSLISTMVLPALVHAITTIQGEHADVEETRWCRCLKRRIQFLERPIKEDALQLAQKILEFPIRRAFMSARSFIENAE